MRRRSINLYDGSEQVTSDLNTLSIPNRDGPNESLSAPPVAGDGVTVYFRDLERHLIDHILAADAVLGCVAWLTNKDILSALAKKDPVAIVVQKEDFLRPDLSSRRGWAAELRRRYDGLVCSWTRHEMPSFVGALSYCSNNLMQPVRCVGNFNRDRSSAFPRMHHKFIVFCRYSTRQEVIPTQEGDQVVEWPELTPYAVWTGSLNFTENGARSLENALFITQQSIVNAYVEEWARIEALSEPLDWESDWTAPEWRLGS